MQYGSRWFLRARIFDSEFRRTARNFFSTWREETDTSYLKSNMLSSPGSNSQKNRLTLVYDFSGRRIFVLTDTSIRLRGAPVRTRIRYQAKVQAKGEPRSLRAAKVLVPSFFAMRPQTWKSICLAKFVEDLTFC